jgi:hypothetical protein
VHGKKKDLQNNTLPLLQRGTRGSQYNHPFLFYDFLMVIKRYTINDISLKKVEIEDKGKRLQHMVHQETRKKTVKSGGRHI